MHEPFLSDDALLADILAVRDDQNHFYLWWLGQSGFLLAWQGHYLLLDPYLSDSLTRKYAQTGKPHVRLTRRAIAPERLNMVELVTSSHNHTDHLDAETILPMLRANPQMQILLPAANQAFAAERLGLPADRFATIDAGLSDQFGHFLVHAVPAAHETIERDEAGRCKYLGYIIEFGPWKIYHSGDTVLYAGQVELLRPYQIDLGILPINGSLPERRVAGNLCGREAAELAHAAQMRMVIPCHYDLFAFNTVTPSEFAQRCTELSQSHHIVQNGQRWSSQMLAVDPAD